MKFNLMTIVYLLGVVLIGFVFYKSFSFIKSFFDKSENKQIDVNEVNASVISENDKKAYKHTEPELKEMTEVIYRLMAGWNTFGVKKQITDILSKINDREFEYMFKHFGLRMSAGGLWLSDYLGSQKNLVEWLRVNLDDENYNWAKTRFDSAKVTFI